jgi:hypothetical protein
MEISNVRIDGSDGIAFTGTSDGTKFKYLVSRETLEDLKQVESLKGEALLEAFESLRPLVIKTAAKYTDVSHASMDPIILRLENF